MIWLKCQVQSWNLRLEDFRACFIDAGIKSCIQHIDAGGFLCVYLGGRGMLVRLQWTEWMDVCEILCWLFDLYTPTSYPTIKLCVGISGPKTTAMRVNKYGILEQWDTDISIVLFPITFVCSPKTEEMSLQIWVHLECCVLEAGATQSSAGHWIFNKQVLALNSEIWRLHLSLSSS